MSLLFSSTKNISKSTTGSNLLCSPARLLLFLGLTLFLGAVLGPQSTTTTTAGVAAAAVPTCRTAQHVTAANIRSVDQRGVLIKVEGDWTNVGGSQPDEHVVKALNGNMTSESGVISIEGAYLFNTSAQGAFIAVTFARVPNYWRGGNNDTVTIRLPNHFFHSGVSCGNFTFPIVPAAGTIDTSFVPSSVSEIDINENDVTFDVYILFDRFLSADVWLVNPANFTVTATLPFGVKSNVLRVTVHRAPDYNPTVGQTDKLVLIFHKVMMQSGVAPIIEDGISITEVAVPFVGVTPIADVLYQTDAGAMRSEDLWDGLAWATLVLKGDVFELNDTLWNLPGTQPTYEAAKPKSPFGFDYFFQCCNMRPNFTLSTRYVNLSFPALVGFTIPSIVDRMELTGLGAVTAEKKTIDPVAFRVLQVKPTSPQVNYTGDGISPFNGTGIDEVDVRRSGFNISILLKYNVWVNPPSAVSVLNMITSKTLGVSTTISYTQMVARVIDRTRLDLTVPAQIPYDISVDEIMQLTIFATMTETRTLMVNGTTEFVIKQFTGSATCALTRSFFIKESDVRNVTGPDITFRIDIAHGTDRFCVTPQAEEDLRNSFSVATGSGNPAMELELDFLWNTSTNISIRIRHNKDFEIAANVFLSMIVPANLMCSFEKCIAEGAGGTGSSKLQLPIGAVAGVLIGTMPRLPESALRTQDNSALIEFIGDAFVIPGNKENGWIPIQTTVNPADPYGRGYVQSYPKAQDFLVRQGRALIAFRIEGNHSRGTFTIKKNESYDIVVEECIHFTIVSREAASKLPPVSNIVPMCIYPEQSFITVLYPNMTIAAATPPPGTLAPPSTTADPNATTVNGTGGVNDTSSTTTETTTTTSTTTTTGAAGTTAAGNVTNVTTAAPTAAPLMPWVINVTEKEILQGNLTINMTLTNDRFDIVHLPAVLRSQIKLHTPDQPSGIQANKQVTFAANAFWFDRNEFAMNISWQPTPGYDITEPESFSLIFNGSLLVSKRNPIQYEVRVFVRPDPGVMTMSGPAMLISSFDIVNGFQSYSIALDGDKFVVGAEAVFVAAELCVVTVGQCSIKMDPSRRNITVTYDPYKAFFISRNETWEIKLRNNYFDSGEQPVGFRNVTVFLSGGKLEWFLQHRSVTEDQVREGKFPGLAADGAIATAVISGDKFASKDEVRQALASSVECANADVNLVGNDPYGFCSRALTLLGSVFFRIENDGTLLKIVLQPDDGFDVYADEVVSFVISGLATSSRKKPTVVGTAGRITITPTAGKYFLSLPAALTEQDLSNAALATKVRLTITLFGERWLSNTTRAVELLVTDLKSSRGSREINGWERYRGQILPAKTAGTTDASLRALDLQFVAVPKYNIFKAEIISVTVPVGAVLSDRAPTLAQEIGTFTVDVVGGFLEGSPGEVDQKVIREQGLNITLQVRQAFWNQLPWLEFKNIDPMFSSNKVPQEEPSGFVVNRVAMLAKMNPGGALPLNNTHVIIMINKVPGYSLIAPETIRMDVKKEFTQAGADGKDLTPPYFEIRVMPEFPLVDAVVYSKVNLLDPKNKYLIEAWRAAVAEKLAVTAPRVVIELVANEWMIPESAPYFRIRFRVTAEDPSVPFDNKYTRLFVSMKREFLEANFNTSFAFFNSTSFGSASPQLPKRAEWLSLEGAGGTGSKELAQGMNWVYVLFFILAVVVVLFIIFGYRRYTQGKDKNGLNWGESKERQAADAKFGDTHEMEEENFDKAAEMLFTGQRTVLPYLADDKAAANAKEQARLDSIAAKHGVVREHTVTDQAQSSSKGYRTRTQRPTADGRDELAFFDVPENCYSGQKSVTKRATDADVGMSLVDRMDAQGTDHSTRISKAGSARINLTDMMNSPSSGSPRSSSKPYEFRSPLEMKQKDPTLFGSESRINDVLEKVAPRGGGTGTGFMTDLRRELIQDTAKAEPGANAAEQKQRLWSDAKADDVMLPPHLVGKVNRFRPPGERR